jgi:hypothetical protein
MELTLVEKLIMFGVFMAPLALPVIIITVVDFVESRRKK